MWFSNHGRSQSKLSSSPFHSSHIASLLLVVLVGVLSSFCLTAADASPAANPYRTFKRYNFVNNANRINRRGFKSSLLSTARGFGKRSGGAPGAPAAETVDHELGDKIPAVLLPEEAAENPRVLDLLANLLDMDEDGMISGEEVERAQEMAAAARRRGGQRMLVH